ncbi:hypothetical protein ABTM76_19200, partial [Acinetobacter baumannii]
MPNQDENPNKSQKIDSIQAASTSSNAVSANKPDKTAASPAKEGFTRGRPVSDFPIEFEWQSG